MPNDNQNECKSLLKRILKMTHPDNYNCVSQYIPKGVEVYLSTLRNEANEAYENNDINSLKRILGTLNGEKATQYDSPFDEFYESNNDNNEAMGLADFFKDMGLEVIDKRYKGGALWVIGTEEEIGNIIDEAVDRFNVYGNYCNGGKATKYRPAWWTADIG